MALTHQVESLSLMVLLLLCCAAGSKAQKPKWIRFQFYVHEILNGMDPTAVKVTARPNYTGPDPIAAIFGSIYIMDNPIRKTADPNSELIGHAQGLYAMTSQTEIVILLTATYSFTAGPYNGSSFSMFGRNPEAVLVREIPIVGGTGMFRFADGSCLVRTHSIENSSNVIGYNATLWHH